MNKRRISYLITSMCICQSLSLSAPIQAVPTGGQIVKYFNPIHEKSYLNEKQDRLIKKKSFKVQEIPGIVPIPNKDIGLFATLDPNQVKDTALIDRLLAKSEVNGLSVLLPWRTIQPDEDTFNWQSIDELLTICGKHKKQLILRISTCGIDESPEKRSDTPDWVFEAGVKSLSYKGKDGKEHLMPIFWDGTYLAKWFNFVNALGERYDKNANLQSVGITGGGILGGTNVIPNFDGSKETTATLTDELQKNHGMNPRQLVGHWKYVADVFPKAFQNQHLNFDINPPTPNRKGEDCLDEISDYLVYRYGQRVYITRQNVTNDKRGFDQYRVLLKLKNDTLAGYQINFPVTAATTETANTDGSAAPAISLAKVAKNAFDDSLSYAEIPAAFFESKNQTVVDWLKQMQLHLGYQIVLQELALSEPIAGERTIHAHFTFINLGAAGAKRPMREMDKEIPSSYKIQLEIKTPQGKVLSLVRHTPSVYTSSWIDGKSITWEQDLKLPALKPGKYDVSLAIVDEKTGHKLNFFSALESKKKEMGNDLPVGSIEIKG